MVKYNPLKIVKSDRRMNWNQVKRKYPGLSARGDMDNDGVKNYKDCRPLDPTRHGIMTGFKRLFQSREEKVASNIERKASQPYRAKMRPEVAPQSLSNLEKSRTQFAGERVKQMLQRGIQRSQAGGQAVRQGVRQTARYAETIPGYQRAEKIQQGLNKIAQQSVGRGKFTTTQLRQSKAIRGLATATFPMIPQKALYTYAQASESKGRGRPKGARATKYVPYNGVYGYRKFIRAQKSAYKYQAELQQAQQKMAQTQQVPTQTGQEVVMQYQQVPQQQQYQQLPQLQTQQQPQFQQPQQFQQYQPQKPPIATVFKSYGGHPFPPVNPPLQRTPQANTYEDTDSFTGQRIIRQRPQAEAWIRPKYGGQ
jgi:hypothetical protein